MVYLAHDAKNDRQVAIKVLRPEITAALGHERFLREITTTANLRHPHILPLYDSGEADGLLYYVMPFVEGESLRDRLIREKQLPVDDALQISARGGRRVELRPQPGPGARDIKPENILLESGHAVVADFGIARAITAAGTETLTQTGLAIGTPQYMSPEQAAGEKELDGRSDLYSLGCVLYEMLAGEPPYTGPSAQAIMARRLTDPVPPLRTVRESVPAGVEQAVTCFPPTARLSSPRAGGHGGIGTTSGSAGSTPAPGRQRPPTPLGIPRSSAGTKAVSTRRSVTPSGRTQSTRSGALDRWARRSRPCSPACAGVPARRPRSRMTTGISPAGRRRPLRTSGWSGASTAAPGESFSEPGSPGPRVLAALMVQHTSTTL